MDVHERMEHKLMQRSATTDCKDESIPRSDTAPEMRRSISMDNGEAEGIKKAVTGLAPTSSFKRRSIRVRAISDLLQKRKFMSV